jgi:hypothetical protein
LCELIQIDLIWEVQELLIIQRGSSGFFLFLLEVTNLLGKLLLKFL